MGIRTHLDTTSGGDRSIVKVGCLLHAELSLYKTEIR